MSNVNIPLPTRVESLEPAAVPSSPASTAALSVRRINVMRVGYLVMGVGLAATKWPTLFNRDRPWPLYEGVTTYLLVALGLLALLGLRYPVKMLPILVLESVWKILWLTLVARPLWTGGHLDSATSHVAGTCLWVVIILAVTPWRYVFAQYVTTHGDPWWSNRNGDA